MSIRFHAWAVSRWQAPRLVIFWFLFCVRISILFLKTNQENYTDVKCNGDNDNEVYDDFENLEGVFKSTNSLNSDTRDSIRSRKRILLSMQSSDKETINVGFVNCWWWPMKIGLKFIYMYHATNNGTKIFGNVQKLQYCPRITVSKLRPHVSVKVGIVRIFIQRIDLLYLCLRLSFVWTVQQGKCRDISRVSATASESRIAGARLSSFKAMA